MKTTLHRPARRTGFSLLELMVVVTIMGVLTAAALPSFRRSVEQARADIAAANLRAIWSAQRIYWQEFRTYTTDLNVLRSLGLIDPTLLSTQNIYSYSITPGSGGTFSATATRVGSSQYSGSIRIDVDGTITGMIRRNGKPEIAPGYQ